MDKNGGLMVEPFGEKSKKFLPEALLVGRNIHAYHRYFPMGIKDSFYLDTLGGYVCVVSIHCASHCNKSGSCSSG